MSSEPTAARLKAFYDQEMPSRADRPVVTERADRQAAFIAEAARRHCRSVLELGCGAGRDGLLLQGAGLDYTGIDLSTTSVQICRDLGLSVTEGSVTDLPFESGSFDCAWSMSTLMHLPGDGLTTALDELRRVVRPGGLVEVGVWGHTTDRDWTSADGRYFKHRTDATLQAALSRLGRLVDFATWDWFDDGGHYQWARVEVLPRAEHKRTA